MNWYKLRATEIVEDEIANGEFPKTASPERKARRIQAIKEWLMAREDVPRSEWNSEEHE